MIHKTPWCAALAGVIGIPALAGRTHAAIVQHTFTSEVTMINIIDGEPDGPPELLAVELGDRMSISYIFDSEAEDLDSLSFIGIYPALSMTIEIGEFMSFTEDVEITVTNELLDSWNVIGGDLDSPSGAGIVLLSGIGITTGDSLVVDLPYGEDVGELSGGLLFQLGSRGFSASPADYSFQIVPAPGAVALFAITGARGRRRRRRRS
jgi:hypothetical protein